ncbi:MAG: aldose 1-epimerase [Acidobacteria bacterium]|nr:aldose 1-epimerase [Acidobacteriota bacterium]
MNYNAIKLLVEGLETVRLRDEVRRAEVSILPSIGNFAWEFTVGGKNLLWFPYRSPAEFQAGPRFCGIPFLAPWANRLDRDAFYANGKKYLLNPNLGNLRRDGNGLPIHGLLAFSPHWSVTALEADDHSAYATSRLEFWRYPDLMAQFPFPHDIRMTYRLKNGALEVETVLENLGSDPMPVAIGYHPYFQLPGTPRDAWRAHLAAREHVVLSKELVPTGERRPLAFADPQPLAGRQLDDVFTGLIRDPDGKARFRVESAGSAITVSYGRLYTTAIAYAPAGGGFICFEPMAALTNAFNLAHEGLYKELQSIPPGGSWRESFWIEPSGF